MKTADYRCKKCGHKWTEERGGERMPLEEHAVLFGHTRQGCPECGSVYFKWLDWRDET